jgi:hypothetical protein
MPATTTATVTASCYNLIVKEMSVNNLIPGGTSHVEAMIVGDDDAISGSSLCRMFTHTSDHERNGNNCWILKLLQLLLLRDSPT